MTEESQIIVLHRAAAPFVPSCLSADVELPLDVHIRRKLLFHLNKTTPQKFERAVARMFELLSSVNTVNLLELVVNMVFEKAVAEPHYGEMYARVCKRLSSFSVVAAGTEEAMEQPATFQLLLISKAQREFEAAVRMGRQAADAVDWRVRRRAPNIAQFMGELYNADELPDPLALHYMQRLSQEGMEQNNETSLECLIVFTTVAGRKLDGAHRVHMDELFTRVSANMAKRCCSIRLHCLQTNLVELRESAWQPRSVFVENRPRTLDELRAEAYREVDSTSPASPQPEA